MLQTVPFVRPPSTPLPDGICPGCGSFRQGHLPYCDDCLTEIEGRWPHSLPAKYAALASTLPKENYR